MLSAPIPLAWDAFRIGQLAAIEVYPAATVCSRQLSIKDYKDQANLHARQSLRTLLAPELEIEANEHEILTKVDVFDATVCVLAGMDFLLGKAACPADLQGARVEGWIWANRRTAS